MKDPDPWVDAANMRRERDDAREAVLEAQRAVIHLQQEWVKLYDEFAPAYDRITNLRIAVALYSVIAFIVGVVVGHL